MSATQVLAILVLVVLLAPTAWWVTHRYRSSRDRDRFNAAVRTVLREIEEPADQRDRLRDHRPSGSHADQLLPSLEELLRDEEVAANSRGTYMPFMRKWGDNQADRATREQLRALVEDGLELRDLAFATLTEAGQARAVLLMDGVEPGFVSVAGSACQYRVQLLQVSTFDATFLIERFAPLPQAKPPDCAPPE